MAEKTRTRTCPECSKQFDGEHAVRQHRWMKHKAGVPMNTRPRPKVDADAFAVTHGRPCCVCGATPTVGSTDLCGPCCFGEAETIGGNW
jgi:NMD protein affecting ribosome stability and mRNA decay